MLNQISQVIKTGSARQPNIWLPLTFVALTGGVLVLLVFTVLIYQLVFLQRAYPGVSIAGMPVGGLTRPEIMSVVSTRTQERLNRPITIHTENQQWTFTGQQLGMQVDVAATADSAFGIGRRGNLLADILTQIALYSHPQQVDPIFRYDTGPTNAVLQQLSRVIDYPPQNARLQINADGSVNVSLSQRGRRLHLGATQPLIEAAIFADGPQDIAAFTQQVLPNINTEDLAPLQQQARSLLAQPFSFRMADDAGPREWQISPKSLAAMVNVQEDVAANGKPQLSLALDSAKLMPYLAQITSTITITPQDARLLFNDDTNQLEVLQPGHSGRLVDITATVQLVSAAVAQGAHQVDLPVQIISPTIPSDNPAALGIIAKVAESTSYFSGSGEGRVRNIALAASKFNGVVVPPGEIFSFNNYLGPITTEAGYDNSFIIFGDRTAVGIGGGVCQVSTTAFRAALYGGFELVERWAHGYRVGWYETNSVPGLDATIYTPDVDFRFRNDTEHYLLIQTETNVDEGTVTFKFYGTPTNREVTVTEPVIENITKPAPPLYQEDATLPPGVIKQVDWAKEGMDVTVNRVVKHGDKIIHQDEIVSHYQPWQAVYHVGAGARIPASALPRKTG